MMEKLLFACIVLFIIVEFLWSQLLDYLNNRSWSSKIPDQMMGFYDEEKYIQAKNYDQEKYRLQLLSSVWSFFITIVFLLCGGFAFLDQLLRSYTNQPILLGLLFFGTMSAASYLLSLPFSIYGTFVIESKYGFNKSTPALFVMDAVKGIFLMILIGGGLLSLVIWLSMVAGNYFWLLAWACISGFSVLMAMFYTSLLLPLFNKLTPLPDGSLKEAIVSYAKQVSFPVNNILVMDGSKRSSKANAFFSGLGPKKSIVLFDTLIAEMSEEEIIAVLAHEVGHYKRKHIYQSIAISIISTGFTLLVFGQLMGSEVLAKVLGTPKSFHIALVVFSMLYSPISLISTPLLNVFSRKNEYEADAYAKATSSAAALVSGLKKMSIQHLSNLSPHPWYVFFHYSHPPLLARIKALEAKS